MSVVYTQRFPRPAVYLSRGMSKLGLLAEPARTPRVEINLNAGPKMDYHLSFDPASEPAHCFVLDISIVGEYGLRLIGPPAREVFAPISALGYRKHWRTLSSGRPTTRRSSTTAC